MRVRVVSNARFSSGVVLLILAVLMCGCASDRPTQNMIATLPIAATTGHAHHLATIVLADLAADTTIADADKAMLRARAEVLRAHAERLSSAIEHFDPQGKANPSITLANLSARAGALNEEHRLAFREWGIWQVRHGLRSAEDIVEVFDIDRAIGN